MAKTTSLPFIGDFTHSQSFGARPAAYAQFGLAGHDGDDWLMPQGTKLYSPLAGQIVRHGNDPSGWGIYLWVYDPAQSLIVNICHFSALQVITGATVRKGQQIGFSGNTGNSSAPHVHVACSDTDSAGNRIDLSNGYKGWYSILDGGRINLVPLSESPAVPEGQTEEDVHTIPGAPQVPSIISPKNGAEFYGAVPEVESSDASGGTGNRTEYMFNISSEVGNWASGWTTSRKYRPPLTNFNNLNYSAQVRARFPDVSGQPESGGSPGITFVLRPNVPPPSTWASKGEWELTTQAVYDSGQGGLYARWNGKVYRTTHSLEDINLPFIGGEPTGLNDEGRVEYATRGDWQGVFYADLNYHGNVIDSIGYNSGFHTVAYGISSIAVVAPPEPLPEPEPEPEPEPIIPPEVEEGTIGDVTEEGGGTTPAPEPTGDGTSSVDLSGVEAKLDQILTKLDGIDAKIGEGVTTPTTEAPPAEEASGFFYVDSTPARASIYIDDQFQYDYTPSNLTYRIAPGTHTLRLHKAGFQDHVEEFQVAAGQTFSKTITLQPEA